MEEDYITDIIRGYEEDLQKVKQDGYALQYVKEQTYELCLFAVKQNGQAINDVKDPLLKAQLKLELNL